MNKRNRVETAKHRERLRIALNCSPRHKLFLIVFLVASLRIRRLVYDAMVVLTRFCGTLSGALWTASMEREEHRFSLAARLQTGVSTLLLEEGPKGRSGEKKPIG